MITPGIVSATFREKTAEEVIALCKAAGLEAVEWSENAHIYPGEHTVPISGWDKMKMRKRHFVFLP